MSAPTTSPASIARPLLRVVAEDGTLRLTPGVVRASMDRALADYESGLRARLDAALQCIEADEATRPLGTARDGAAALADRVESARPRLRLAPPPGPEQPATACPPWCVVGVDHEDGDRCHAGDVRRPAGWLDVSLHIGDDDALCLRVGVDSAEGATMNLAEVDELIAGLTRVRAELADALSSYRQPIAAGGAA